MIRVHGTCVAIGGAGILLRGPSGSGKSDLALRLIDDGAILVADDQVELVVESGGLIANPPKTIAGLFEVRGLGIVNIPHVKARIALVVDLTPGQPVERMPEDEGVDVIGVRLPHLIVDPWEASAAAKVRLAVKSAAGTIMRLR